jgi:hypothetical protein
MALKVRLLKRLLVFVLFCALCDEVIYRLSDHSRHTPDSSLFSLLKCKPLERFVLIVVDIEGVALLHDPLRFWGYWGNVPYYPYGGYGGTRGTGVIRSVVPQIGLLR